MRKVARQRGAAKLGTLLTLAVVAFVAYEAYQFAPILFAQYEFKDAVVEEAKFSRGKEASVITRSLLDKARELNLPIEASMITVTRKPTSTRIQVQYRLTVEWLPGKPYTWEVNDIAESVLF